MNKKELKELRDYLKAERKKEDKVLRKSFWMYLNKVNLVIGGIIAIIGFLKLNLVIAFFGAVIYNLSVHREDINRLEELVVNGCGNKNKD